uniref:Uncharacterized protein n=1 Tax=Romanomermis culicivorax TaxID=13658 RepID=A0A915JW27_ROMCU
MDQKAGNNNGAEKRRWGSEKDQPASYTPFKSINGGRPTSYMDDIYQPSMSMRCDADVAAINETAAHHQPGRAPSRAGSIYASSVLYQPLTSANQVNAAWGNSMIKPLSSDSGVMYSNEVSLLFNWSFTAVNHSNDVSPFHNTFSSTTLPPPTANGGRLGGGVQAEPDPYNNNNNERSRKQAPGGTVARSASNSGYEQRQQQGFLPPAYNGSNSPDLQLLSASKLNGKKER